MEISEISEERKILEGLGLGETETTESETESAPKRKRMSGELGKVGIGSLQRGHQTLDPNKVSRLRLNRRLSTTFSVEIL